jgi:hypothetical protein
MKGARGIEKMLRLLETEFDRHQAECAAATELKTQLRDRQIQLWKYEQELLDVLDRAEVLEPDAFRLRELRLQKLDQMRRDLQPHLARAALEYQSKWDALKKVMRIQAMFELQLEQMRKNARGNELSAAEELALFEFRKRF